MTRRDFMAALAALTASTALTVKAAPDLLMPFWERGWDFTIAENFETRWWHVTAVFRPTGVRYGWRVSTTFLVERDMTAEEFVAQQLRSVNPHYAEETLASA